jgi:hypothetical protein
MSVAMPVECRKIWECAWRLSLYCVDTGGLRLWTHFDVMDNILCQIRGTKRIRLWPPEEVGRAEIRTL